MDELDEIAQLEAAGQKLMAEPAPPLRKRGAAASNRSPVVGSNPLQGDNHKQAERQPITEGGSAPVESLLVEIRDRLDLLLQANDPSRGAPRENPQPPESTALHLSATVAEESDELRKAFPHEDADPGQRASLLQDANPPPVAPAAVQEATPANITVSDSDMARLLATIEDRVTRHALTHHSSVVVLLGWAMALLATGLGMGYGYIVASGRYPFWEPTAHSGILPRISAAVLGAPVGVVLLPLAGAILWEASKEASSEKQQAILRLAAIGVFLAGILLPLISLL
jgi:hypothetical protein